MVGARSRRKRKRGEKVLYLQLEKCFHRSLINQGQIAPELADSVRVLDSAAGWGRQSFGIWAKGWILTVSSLVEKAASCPTFFFLRYVPARFINVKDWPASPNVRGQHFRRPPYHCCCGLQLDAPAGLRRRIFGSVSHFTNLTFLLVPKITPPTPSQKGQVARLLFDSRGN